jgi:NAD(P)-dependent dehydrogenase (short-subunit alcohol dehydrogenase family)
MQVALITGTSSGIGLVTARAFVTAGIAVVGVWTHSGKRQLPAD